MIQVAVNKPSGLQVLPGGLFQQRTVLTQLQWRSDSSDKQATHGIAALQEKDLWKPSPVHRLGRGTSGLSLILNIIIIHRHFGPWNRLTISACSSYVQEFCSVQNHQLQSHKLLLIQLLALLQAAEAGWLSFLIPPSVCDFSVRYTKQMQRLQCTLTQDYFSKNHHKSFSNCCSLLEDWLKIICLLSVQGSWKHSQSWLDGIKMCLLSSLDTAIQHSLLNTRKWWFVHSDWNFEKCQVFLYLFQSGLNAYFYRGKAKLKLTSDSHEDTILTFFSLVMSLQWQPT